LIKTGSEIFNGFMGQATLAFRPKKTALRITRLYNMRKIYTGRDAKAA